MFCLSQVAVTDWLDPQAWKATQTLTCPKRENDWKEGSRRSNKYCLDFLGAWGLISCYDQCPLEACFSPPRFKDWEIITLHLTFWHRTLVFPVMPLRLAAKVHIPSPLDLTSLVTLHCKSSFLPLANLCVLGVFWEYCRLSSFICGVLSSLYLETLTLEVDIYLMLERKIPLLYLTPTW